MEHDATRIVAIRHGQTAWNAASRIQGHTDIALDATGLWQAERLAEALAGDELHAVYSSDLQRACATAAPLARRQGLPTRLDAGLRERGFGAFEGLSFAQIEQRWPEQAARWRQRDPDFGAHGGEVLRDFRERVVAAVTRLARAHPGRNIVLVTHGGVLDMLYREAARLALDAPRTWQVPNAGINRLLHADEGLVLVGWGDVGHLEGVPDERL
ncbi:MAG TPA: histidine phosphatase family protein [Rubrivivax sp.]|nr:histidine phosphatase family protein [Rubrivivax sp.]